MKIRNARICEIDCSKHFENDSNYKLFISPGPLACFRHTSHNECIFFLGDDLNEKAFEESKEALLGLVDKGVTKELVLDLVECFELGYAYALLYGR
jgi:hypothetical protein